MIRAKTTSGMVEFNSYPPREYTAGEILDEVQKVFPRPTLKWVEDEVTHHLYGPDDVIPDGSTVVIVSEQPTDA